jgi:hypothetical protein
VITIDEAMAPVLVVAIRDAIKHNTVILEAASTDDPGDHEEFLEYLAQLEAEVREQYLRMQARSPEMIPYAQLMAGSADGDDDEDPSPDDDGRGPPT